MSLYQCDTSADTKVFCDTFPADPTQSPPPDFTNDMVLLSTYVNGNDVNNYLYGLVLEKYNVCVYKFGKYHSQITGPKDGLFLFSLTHDVTQGKADKTIGSLTFQNDGNLYIKMSDGSLISDPLFAAPDASSMIYCLKMAVSTKSINPSTDPLNYLQAIIANSSTGQPTGVLQLPQN